LEIDWSGGDVADLLAEPGADPAAIRKLIEQSAQETAVETDEPPKSGTMPFQPFPVEALPEPVRAFVLSVAGATGTDPAYAALASLVVIAGCIGNRVVAVVKPGWSEPAVSWGMLVGRSGAVKSPVLRLVTRALTELAKANNGQYADMMAEYRRETERYAVRLAAWKAAQRGVPTTDPPEEPVAPSCPRLLVEDSTFEQLGVLLEKNPLGLLLVCDELAAWVGAFDRYAAGGKGSDRARWLSVYDAASITVDRKTGQRHLYVERAAVSVLGTTQPGTLGRTFGTEERDAGLLARVFVVYPPENPVRWTDAGLDTDVEETWRKTLEGLIGLQPDDNGGGSVTPRALPLSSEAKAIFVAWHDRHASELAEIGSDDLEAYFAKLKGGCIRLALTQECVTAVTSRERPATISADAMRRAITLIEWFKYEGRRVYAILREDDGERKRRRLVEWISRWGGAVSVRDLTHGLNGFRGNPAAARAALDALVHDDLGRWEYPAPGRKGGRPAARFVLTPAKASVPPTADEGEHRRGGSGGAVPAPPRPSGNGQRADEGACAGGAASDVPADEAGEWGTL
jgi:hypothetical protein